VGRGRVHGTPLTAIPLSVRATSLPRCFLIHTRSARSSRCCVDGAASRVRRTAGIPIKHEFAITAKDDSVGGHNLSLVDCAERTWHPLGLRDIPTYKCVCLLYLRVLLNPSTCPLAAGRLSLVVTVS
jgi:hypothetical protein